MEKRTKNLGTREKSSQAPFAHAAYCEPSVGHLLVTPGYRLFSGCCGTWSARLYKKNYTRANLQTASHNGLKTSGPALDFSTVPFRFQRRITFAMRCSIALPRKMVIPKENRHCQMLRVSKCVKACLHTKRAKATSTKLNYSWRPLAFRSKARNVWSAAALFFLFIMLDRTSPGAPEWQRTAFNGTIAGEQCLRRREL